MKADIHPKYEAVTMRCACGNTIETRSTNPDIHVEICAACHPYFTGKQRLMDTAGRVERFRQRYAAANSSYASATSRTSWLTPPSIPIRAASAR